MIYNKKGANMKKGKKLGIIGVTVIMIAQLFGCGKDV